MLPTVKSLCLSIVHLYLRGRLDDIYGDNLLREYFFALLMNAVISVALIRSLMFVPLQIRYDELVGRHEPTRIGEMLQVVSHRNSIELPSRVAIIFTVVVSKQRLGNKTGQSQ